MMLLVCIIDEMKEEIGFHVNGVHHGNVKVGNFRPYIIHAGGLSCKIVKTPKKFKRSRGSYKLRTKGK